MSRDIIEGKSPLILALDTSDLSEGRRIADEVNDYVDIVKVGLQLFSTEGPAAIKALRDDGFEVFLDIKMNDIPNTVSSACIALCEEEPIMLTLHTFGGQEMMRAAAAAVRLHCSKANARRPLLIGVTVLTSLDILALKKIGVAGQVQEEVMRLAGLAESSDMDGLVTSPLEVLQVRREVGDGMILIAPGVRPSGAGRDDQKRIATPAEAVRSGADFLVVGRPLYQAPDPGKVARSILDEIRSPQHG